MSQEIQKALTLKNQFISMLKAHDWFHDFSDDIRVWRRGQDSWQEIQRMANLVPDANSLIKQYRKY